jgi:hypothetical protein
LFERSESEEIGDNLPEVQEAVNDYKRFSRIVHLKAFSPFTSPENALENINDVSEGAFLLLTEPFGKFFIALLLQNVILCIAWQ